MEPDNHEEQPAEESKAAESRECGTTPSQQYFRKAVAARHGAVDQLLKETVHERN